MPKSVSLISYGESIPKYYVLANKIHYRNPSQAKFLSSSIAIMFQSFDSYERGSSAKNWSYCSFEPSNTESLHKAVNWLTDYTMRYEYNPIILNDFDEYHDYFSDPVEFPLRVLGKGVIDATRIKTYEENYNIQIHTEKVVMGDSFKNISNATIINRALVENSFNKLKKEYNEQVNQALVQIADFIQKSDEPAAGILFAKFNEQLNEPQLDNPTLINIWASNREIVTFDIKDSRSA